MEQNVTRLRSETAQLAGINSRLEHCEWERLPETTTHPSIDDSSSSEPQSSTQSGRGRRIRRDHLESFAWDSPAQNNGLDTHPNHN
jgi:hypothetical protein